MASPVLAEQVPATHKPVASAAHTVLMLTIVLSLAYVGAQISASLRSAPDAHRLSTYARTIVTQWILLGLVAWGVRRHGDSLRDVWGKSWSSTTEFATDVALAAGFWIIVLFFLSFLRSLIHPFAAGHSILFLLPHTATERAAWILLSITAGICEEAIHRGYFQRQFIAASGSLVVGILLSGVLFGLMHAYQGAEGAIVNGTHGMLLGALAAWRRSLRPGMIAHAWGDIFAGVFAAMMRIKVT